MITRHALVTEQTVVSFFISNLQNCPQTYTYYHDAVQKKYAFFLPPNKPNTDEMCVHFTEKVVLGLFVDKWSVPDTEMRNWEYMYDALRQTYIVTMTLEEKEVEEVEDNPIHFSNGFGSSFDPRFN